MRIALDAMGGDHAPEATVAGALRAASEDLQILLVGDEAVLREQLGGGTGPHLRLVHAAQQVEMDESPRSTLRRKRDSSLRVCFQLAVGGEADAVVTMGHSGAALAMGMFVGSRLDGVPRPAIAAVVPGDRGPVVLLDAGANVECKPEHLGSFAVLGATFSRVAFRRARPSVALLSNGEEANKGTPLTRAAAALITADPRLDFVGYVEPADLLRSRADVVVTDGWTGNLVLKTAEATFSWVQDLMRRAAATSTLSRVGGALLKPALQATLPRVDGVEAGGGLLLGVDTCAVIGHGSADAEAVASALRFANRLSRDGLVERLGEVLAAPY